MSSNNEDLYSSDSTNSESSINSSQVVTREELEKKVNEFRNGNLLKVQIMTRTGESSEAIEEEVTELEDLWTEICDCIDVTPEIVEFDINNVKQWTSEWYQTINMFRKQIAMYFSEHSKAKSPQQNRKQIEEAEDEEEEVEEVEEETDENASDEYEEATDDENDEEQEHSDVEEEEAKEETDDQQRETEYDFNENSPSLPIQQPQPTPNKTPFKTLDPRMVAYDMTPSVFRKQQSISMQQYADTHTQKLNPLDYNQQYTSGSLPSHYPPAMVQQYPMGYQQPPQYSQQHQFQHPQERQPEPERRGQESGIDLNMSPITSTSNDFSAQVSRLEESVNIEPAVEARQDVGNISNNPNRSVKFDKSPERSINGLTDLKQLFEQSKRNVDMIREQCVQASLALTKQRAERDKLVMELDFIELRKDSNSHEDFFHRGLSLLEQIKEKYIKEMTELTEHQEMYKKEARQFSVTVLNENNALSPLRPTFVRRMEFAPLNDASSVATPKIKGSKEQSQSASPDNLTSVGTSLPENFLTPQPKRGHFEALTPSQIEERKDKQELQNTYDRLSHTISVHTTPKRPSSHGPKKFQTIPMTSLEDSVPVPEPIRPILMHNIPPSIQPQMNPIPNYISARQQPFISHMQYPFMQAPVQANLSGNMQMQTTTHQTQAQPAKVKAPKVEKSFEDENNKPESQRKFRFSAEDGVELAKKRAQEKLKRQREDQERERLQALERQKKLHELKEKQQKKLEKERVTSKSREHVQQMLSEIIEEEDDEPNRAEDELLQKLKIEEARKKATLRAKEARKRRDEEKRRQEEEKKLREASRFEKRDERLQKFLQKQETTDVVKPVPEPKKIKKVKRTTEQPKQVIHEVTPQQPVHVTTVQHSLPMKPAYSSDYFLQSPPPQELSAGNRSKINLSGLDGLQGLQDFNQYLEDDYQLSDFDRVPDQDLHQVDDMEEETQKLMSTQKPASSKPKGNGLTRFGFRKRS